jgi:hypothetical protein
MRAMTGAAIGLALLLAGSGNDSDDSAAHAELSGVLQAGNVSGVHYQTATRDGVTDASGTFKYLAGETAASARSHAAIGVAPLPSVISDTR